MVKKSASKGTKASKRVRSGLRDLAMSTPVPLNRKASWLDRLDEERRQEFMEFVYEWDDGGELRERYPSNRSLCTFLSTVDFIPLKRSSLDELITRLIKERDRE